MKGEVSILLRCASVFVVIASLLRAVENAWDWLKPEPTYQLHSIAAQIGA